MARFVQIEYEDKYDLLEKQERIDFIDTYSAAYRKQVIGAVCGRFVLGRTAHRAEAGTLDFHDLLVRARQLLA